MNKNERMCKKEVQMQDCNTIDHLFLLFLLFSVPNSVAVEITLARSIFRLTMLSL